MTDDELRATIMAISSDTYRIVECHRFSPTDWYVKPLVFLPEISPDRASLPVIVTDSLVQSPSFQAIMIDSARRQLRDLVQLNRKSLIARRS